MSRSKKNKKLKIKKLKVVKELSAFYLCLKCKHKWSDKPSGVSCMKCGSKYVKWLNFSEYEDKA